MDVPNRRIATSNAINQLLRQSTQFIEDIEPIDLLPYLLEEHFITCDENEIIRVRFLLCAYCVPDLIFKRFSVSTTTAGSSFILFRYSAAEGLSSRHFDPDLQESRIQAAC